MLLRISSRSSNFSLGLLSGTSASPSLSVCFPEYYKDLSFFSSFKSTDSIHHRNCRTGNQKLRRSPCPYLAAISQGWCMESSTCISWRRCRQARLLNCRLVGRPPFRGWIWGTGPIDVSLLESQVSVLPVLENNVKYFRLWDVWEKKNTVGMSLGRRTLPRIL